jgi:ribosomal protein S18 acetylase RimI-like enzyme
MVAPAGPNDMNVVRTMFTEYADWLAVDLTFQGFREELETLPGRYGEPGGTILIAWQADPGDNSLHGHAAGCVALRPLGERQCEMKRLWVRERFRRLGVGRLLAARVMEIAAGRGYRSMVLDTLESMAPALRLYETCGFGRIAPYYENPLPGVVYMGRKL